MKKLILILLFFTGALQAQTLQNPTFGNTTTNTLKIKTPATVTSVNFLASVELDGSVNKISTVNLGFASDANVLHKTGNETKTSGTLTLNDQLKLANGTVFNPSILFPNEDASDTGINHANNGEIQFITNGSNLTQIDGVGVKSASFVKNGGLATQYLMANGSVSTLTNPITGTGTVNYVPKFTSASVLGNSLIFDSGTNIGVGTNSPNYTLDVNGTISARTGSIFSPIYLDIVSMGDMVFWTNGISRGGFSSSGFFKVNGLSGTGTRNVNVDASGNLVAGGLDSDNLKTSSNQSFTGVKTSTNTGSTQVNGVLLTNNGTSGSYSLRVSNSSTGDGISAVNSSAGQGMRMINSGSGIGYSSGNTGSGIGLYLQNSSTGDLSVYNGLTSSSGFLIVGQNNSSNTYTLDKSGNVTANTFVKTGGASNQTLQADGSVLVLRDRVITSSTSTITLPTTARVMYYVYKGTGNVTWNLPVLASSSDIRFVIINKSATGTITLPSGTNQIWDSGTTSSSTTCGPGASMEIYNDSENFVIL